MDRCDAEVEQALVDIARQVLPGGGLGNVSHEIVIAKGHAGRVQDVAGREYVDFVMGSGPMILGHAHPEVIDAVRETVGGGTTFFANNEDGIRLAADIVDAVACAEQVRFVSTGSEAGAFAMRLARAHTGRDKILKFEGGYHGMSDYGLMSLAPVRTSNFPRGIPDSAGIPACVQDLMLVAPFNDLETAASLVREHGQDLAAIIVEPFQRLIAPVPGFLEGLRTLASDNGALLIFDEVVTGFRLAYGGAQARYGVTPDICILGKAIGGGFPLAAIAGPKAIMAHFDKSAADESGFMMQVGTLSGNPVAAAAGRKTLEILRRPGTYERIFATGRALMDGFANIIAAQGVDACVVGIEPFFDVVFTDRPVRDYRSALSEPLTLRRYNALMRERGILKGDNKFYVSAAHSEEDVQLTLDAFAETVALLAPSLSPRMRVG